jgi:diaminobutyrate-2-oxoglutarate transaminase
VAAFAAGAAAIDFMTRTNLAGHAAELGGWMLGQLKRIAADSPIIGEARGIGLMLGIEFVRDKVTKEPAPELAKNVRSLCHKRGLLLEVGGHYDNVARFLPPLVVTRDLAAKGLEIFADAVQKAGEEDFLRLAHLPHG